jgi:hypothetical protein
MASPAPQAAQQQPMPADASEDLPFWYQRNRCLT